MIDYQAEYKRISEGSNYWKPKPGQYKIRALSEIEEAPPYIKKRDGQDDEVHEQMKLLINVDGEDKIWTFGKGSTPASTYGQLLHLASIKNQIKDIEFNVIVKFDGTKNDYTIVLNS